MKWKEWPKSVAGTAREHLGVAATSVGVIVAIMLVAAGGFAGCHKQETAAMADTFPVKPVPTSGTPKPKPTVAAKPQPKSTIIVYVTGAVKRPGVYTLADDARLYHAIRAAGGFKSNAVTDALNLADRAQDGDQLCVPSRVAPKVSRPVSQAVAIAQPRMPAVETAPLIRKTLLPAPVVLPTPGAPEESEPTVTVIAPTPTPPAPGRVLGVPTTAATAEPPPSITAEPPQIVLSSPPSGRITLPKAPGKTTRSATKTSAKFKNPGDGIVHINSATAAELEQLPRCGPAMSAKILAYRAQIGGRFTDLRQLMDVKGVGEKTFEKWQPFLAL